MTDDILFFCAKMMVGHDGLLSDMSVGRASLYQKIPSCPNFYLMWCTLKWNSPSSNKMSTQTSLFLTGNAEKEWA